MFENVMREVNLAAREHVLVAALGIPRLLRDPVWREADPHQGRGTGVLLVPGFLAGARSLSLTAQWLRARGYRPRTAHVGLNVGCTRDMVQRVEHDLERLASAGPVVLIGQSRGGGLARLIAARRPELVRALVMLGTPVLDPLGAHPQVMRVARMFTRLSTLGMRGLLDPECLSGPCYDEHRPVMSRRLKVPALAVFSRRDEIAPWHLCQDPYAECVEVSSTHTGMAIDPDFYRALEPRLARWASPEYDGDTATSPARKRRRAVPAPTSAPPSHGSRTACR